jgi:hypothetical protein
MIKDYLPTFAAKVNFEVQPYLLSKILRWAGLK